MRTQQAILAAILLLATLLGGAYYYVVGLPGQAETQSPEGATWTTLEPRGSEASPGGGTSADINAARSDEIIKCRDPEVGEFYTNARTCAEADPHGRITVAEPLNQTPAENTYSGQNFTTPEQDAGNSRTER